MAMRVKRENEDRRNGVDSVVVLSDDCSSLIAMLNRLDCGPKI